MANRFPIIFNESSGQLQEIAIGDNLDLSSSGIANALSIGGTSLSIDGDAIVGGALTVAGNFTVNGTQTIINTTELNIADKTVGIASTSTPSDSTADGAGIVVFGTTDKSLLYNNASGNFILTGAGLSMTDELNTHQILEKVNVVASPVNSGAGATVNLDTSAVHYYTSDATANWTQNITGVGETVSAMLNVGQSATISVLASQGSTAYYNTGVQIDGSAVGITTYWQGGTAPTAGNASGIDAYTYTIIKTAATPTYIVLASQTQFTA